MTAPHRMDLRRRTRRINRINRTNRRTRTVFPAEALTPAAMTSKGMMDNYAQQRGKLNWRPASNTPMYNGTTHEVNNEPRPEVVSDDCLEANLPSSFVVIVIRSETIDHQVLRSKRAQLLRNLRAIGQNAAYTHHKEHNVGDAVAHKHAIIHEIPSRQERDLIRGHNCRVDEHCSGDHVPIQAPAGLCSANARTVPANNGLQTSTSSSQSAAMLHAYMRWDDEPACYIGELVPVTQASKGPLCLNRL
jgi:hypothetical protein